jgi:hypothetical protein
LKTECRTSEIDENHLHKIIDRPVAIVTSYELRHSISGNSIPYLKTDLSPIIIDNGNATIPYLMITRGEPNSNINAIIEFVKSNIDWSKPDLN